MILGSHSLPTRAKSLRIESRLRSKYLLGRMILSDKSATFRDHALKAALLFLHRSFRRCATGLADVGNVYKAGREHSRLGRARIHRCLAARARHDRELMKQRRHPSRLADTRCSV